MGLFDNIDCDREMPDGFRSKRGYQTKDLGQGMEVYRIRDDRLELSVRDYEPDGPPQPHFLLKGETYQPLKMVRERWVDQHHHGTIRFYDSEGDPRAADYVWHEYEARFTDGRLVEIVVMAPRHTHIAKDLRE